MDGNAKRVGPVRLDMKDVFGKFGGLIPTQKSDKTLMRFAPSGMGESGEKEKDRNPQRTQIVDVCGNFIIVPA